MTLGWTPVWPCDRRQLEASFRADGKGAQPASLSWIAPTMQSLDPLLQMAALVAGGTASTLSLAARELGADERHPLRLTKTLAILSLVFASISVVCTLSTLYWFVKMKRSFRHE